MWQRKMTQIENIRFDDLFVVRVDPLFIENIRCSNIYLADAMNTLCTLDSVQPLTAEYWVRSRVAVGVASMIDCASWTVTLSTKDGHVRKTTGSYYTPMSLINRLLDSTLEPVMDKAIHGKSQSEQERALLALRICDPSCGSGYFLVCGQTIGDATLTDRLEIRNQLQMLYKSPCERWLEYVFTGGHQSDVSRLCKVSLWMYP